MTVKPEILDFREIKVYRRHNCYGRHRNETTFIECALGKKLNWVVGVGQYASISWCNYRGKYGRRYVTVMLFETLEEAQQARGFIDHAGCGSACENFERDNGKHQVVRVDVTGSW